MPTKFQNKVYELCKKVPKGKVTTYKAIAQKMRTKAYRAVGQALNRNPYAPKVPCHRVVSSKGHLHGFASGLKAKAKLLKKEGVEIKNNKVDLSRVLFRF
jgi:methylated-DNA-[protein]-cysteine S-methyltransferase